jgi:hypothetical protein
MNEPQADPINVMMRTDELGGGLYSAASICRHAVGSDIGGRRPGPLGSHQPSGTTAAALSNSTDWAIANHRAAFFLDIATELNPWLEGIRAFPVLADGEGET